MISFSMQASLKDRQSATSAVSLSNFGCVLFLFSRSTSAQTALMRVIIIFSTLFTPFVVIAPFYVFPIHLSILFK